MYKTVNINGQRINLNNIAGYTTSGTDVVFDLNGGMNEDETPYILIRLASIDRQTQLLNFLDKEMSVLHFFPIKEEAL